MGGGSAIEKKKTNHVPIKEIQKVYSAMETIQCSFFAVTIVCILFTCLWVHSALDNRDYLIMSKFNKTLEINLDQKIEQKWEQNKNEILVKMEQQWNKKFKEQQDQIEKLVQAKTDEKEEEKTEEKEKEKEKNYYYSLVPHELGLEIINHTPYAIENVRCITIYSSTHELSCVSREPISRMPLSNMHMINGYKGDLQLNLKGIEWDWNYFTLYRYNEYRKYYWTNSETKDPNSRPSSFITCKINWYQVTGSKQIIVRLELN